jgi:glycosyltransferase involved in cell wall biosynthesis
VWETGDPWNSGRGGNPHDPRYSYTRQADYVSGAALMIPAALWKQLDGFGAEYAPAYFEDTDLAFKVKNAGRKVVYAARAVVVHHEGISHGTDAEEATSLKRYQEVNRPKFKRKWSALYAGNGKVGDNVDRAKDRGIARRVLFIDKEFPRPDRDAGSYAAIQEIRMFQALGCKVTFAPLNMAYLGRHTDDLQRLGVEAIHTPFHSSVAAFLQARGGEFDLIYITRYGVAGQLLDQLRQHAPQARLVINVADLHFLRLMREARIAGDDTALTAALDTREAELAVLGRAELVLTYSTIEQAVIASHIARGPRTGIVPWVIDTLPLEAGFAARRDVAFLGGFGHPPNISAVKYFAAEVMPLLRKSLPGCRFLVYGSNVPPDIQALAGDDIIIAGYVREVAEVFDSCRVFVAPLLSGAGMKGKVLDCMAAGIPSVLSPVAAEGIGLRDGIDTLIARTPAEWAEAIARLYRDEALWTAMSANVQDLARRHYGFAAAVTALAEALAAIEFYVTPSSHSLCVTAARPLFETGPVLAAEAEMIPARPG